MFKKITVLTKSTALFAHNTKPGALSLKEGIVAFTPYEWNTYFQSIIMQSITTLSAKPDRKANAHKSGVYQHQNYGTSDKT